MNKYSNINVVHTIYNWYFIANQLGSSQNLRVGELSVG